MEGGEKVLMKSGGKGFLFGVVVGVIAYHVVMNSKSVKPTG